MKYDIAKLKQMIRELCELFDRDSIYLPKELQVSNGWNGGAKGFFKDGEVIIYCQGDNTDWDDCVSLIVFLNGFGIFSRGTNISFSKKMCEEFADNIIKFYEDCMQPEKKHRLELHKEHDSDIWDCRLKVVNLYWDKLRLNNYNFRGKDPNYDRYKRIESAIDEYKVEHFLELCDMTHNQRISQFSQIAAQTK